MTASELEALLVRALAARTHGQVQELTVRILGGRTVLSGFAESYYAIQLALVGLQEAVGALGLDRPGRVTVVPVMELQKWRWRRTRPVGT